MIRTIVWAAGLFSAMAANAGEAGVAQGLNRFSSDIYEQVAKPAKGNLALSPFSISSALSMALVGARGDTAAEMAKLLGVNKDDPKYHAELAALVEQIVKAANTGGNQLSNANGLWVQKDFKILPDFRDTLQNVYRAPAGELDFAGNPEAAREAINQWTEKHTNGKIHDLFARGSLKGDTRLVLGSAIYFYGKWEHAFRRTETHPAPFTLPSGGSAQVDFMNQKGRFGYAETSAGQVLEMRYAGTGLAFDILLPKKGTSVDSMDSEMNPDKLAGWLGGLENTNVYASVPKFRVESQFPLAGVLASMGMPSAFSSSANFSGIDDKRDLQISQVVHKAYVDVSEEGTEAAAATGVGVALVAMVKTQEPLFRADHPFLWVIRDTKSGTVLFVGRVVDPRSKTN